MKQLLLVGLLAVGTVGVGRAQQLPGKAEEKDEVIYIQTSDTGERALLKLGHKFMA